MNTKPQQILVIDDEPVIRDMMVDILDIEGYTTEVARNGQDALTKLYAADPSIGYLIFLDLMMPVMDGKDFCQQLSANPELRHRHIIVVMSALSQLSQVGALHIDATMSKPFVVDDVMKIIQRYMD